MLKGLKVSPLFFTQNKHGFCNLSGLILLQAVSLVEQVIEQLVNGADPRAMSPLQQDSMVDTARSSQQNGGISAFCVFTI